MIIHADDGILEGYDPDPDSDNDKGAIDNSAEGAVKDEQPSQQPAEEAEPPVDTGAEQEQTNADPETNEDLLSMIKAMGDKLEKLSNQNASLHRRLGKTKKQNVPEPIDETTAPKAASYETIEEYERARTEWDIDRRVNEQVRKALEVDPHQDRKEALDEFRTTVMAAGAGKYEDFAAVVGDPDLPLTFDVIDAVRQGDNESVSPVEVLYYLGRNKAEADRISRLNSIQIGREIVKIENKIEKQREQAKPSQPGKQPSRIKEHSDAAAPIKPTGSSTIIVTKDPEKMSQAEYEAWRRGGGGS